MILPTKGIPPRRALISVGAGILALLVEPKTVSRLWDEYRRGDAVDAGLTFDWFVLALDLLFTMDAIELHGGRVRKLAKGSGP